MFQAKDGQRTLEFDGELLAESTSQKRGGTRWVEFKLYKTLKGSYILSRTGCSIIFHDAQCELVKQYNLKPGPITRSHIPCDYCYPDYTTPDLHPEKIRNWAQVMEKPTAVLEALYKYDSDGARYLTLVAQRLLEEAATRDEGIRRIYQTEYVQ